MLRLTGRGQLTIIKIENDNKGGDRVESKADLMLHPVRLRVIQVLLGRAMTVQEIAAAMPDVPQATLYRHLNKLSKGGVVSVAAENRVRGAIERVYEVSPEQAVVGPEEIGLLDRDDHMRLFMTFVASLLDGFQRYLRQEHLDLAADGVSYRQATLFLDDEEFSRFIRDLANVYREAMVYGPGPGRRERTVSSIIIPEPILAHDGDATGKGDAD
jgi:DNA-binding transcriptional ArsR family regulator